MSSAEAQRQAVLARYGVLDTSPEQAFDRLTALAARLFEVPMALVSLVDRSRLFFKSCFGLDLRQSDRKGSFCNHTVLSGQVTVVPDTTRDLRFAAGAFAAYNPPIRFYAGAPLTTPEGVTLGTLCILDTAPHPIFSSEQRALLAEMAAMVVEVLEHRRLTRAVERERAFLQAVLDHATDAIVACNAEGELTLFNRASRALHGLPEQPLGPGEWSRHYDLYEADGVTPLALEQIPLYRAYKDGAVKDASMVVVPKGAAPRQLEVSGQAFTDAEGAPLGAVVAMRDVTAERAAEVALRQSEWRYRTVVGSLSEGVVQQEADGSISTCNAAAEQILGLTQDQMVGRDAFDPRWRAVREDGSPYPGEEHPSMTALRTGVAQLGQVMGVHKPDGSLTWIAVNAQPLFHVGAAQPYAVVSSFSDITGQKHLEAQLRYSALHDPLTGLPTRALLQDRLEGALAYAERHPSFQFALLYLDLDGFKAVNDTLGHRAGDDLLIEVANRLRACVREGDTVARLGGDEFAALLGGLKAPEDAYRLAERVVNALVMSVAAEPTLPITASVGVALPEPGLNAAEQLARADTAMYRAKRAGKGRYVVVG